MYLVYTHTIHRESMDTRVVIAENTNTRNYVHTPSARHKANPLACRPALARRVAAWASLWTVAAQETYVY